MSTADPHPAPNDPTLPPLNDPFEEDDDADATATGSHPAALA
ncbi:MULTISPECIES: hypothetical protein [unclassified Microbacterium]|nr:MULTISPECIES: hypothetical protein [unclassified Microbacterium]